MLPKFHILFGLIFSGIVLFIFPQIQLSGFLIIWASSVLIDIDHYLYYVYRKKDWNLNNSFNWFIDLSKKYNKLSIEQREKVYFGFYFLHGAEAILILLIFIYFFQNIILIYILIGFLFHQLLDLIDLYIKKMKSYKLVSFLYSIHKKKGKKYIEEIN
ncbi:MAG: hypothetical protein WC781_03620 [Candidatus Pacearchaeota archaeon]|jgi:hypothetical protein